MKTAKLFANGQSQAVRLPKDYRFKGDEVGIMKVGEVVLLYPKDKKDTLFLSSIGNFTDDFFDSIESARNEFKQDKSKEVL